MATIAKAQTYTGLKDPCSSSHRLTGADLEILKESGDEDGRGGGGHLAGFS